MTAPSPSAHAVRQSVEHPTHWGDRDKPAPPAALPRDPATMTVAEWIAEKLHLRAAA